MKNLFILIISLIIIPNTFAGETANIHLKINDPAKDNRYFLCLPNVGCLSIAAATHGKIYPVYHPINMSSIYIMDASNRLLISRQTFPASCNVTVNENQSITISGTIQKTAGNSVHIAALHCSVS